MARTKKTQETNSRRKKVQDEDEENVSEEEQIEEEPKSRKLGKRQSNKKDKKSKKSESEDDEDKLSDLDVEGIEVDDDPIETSENDEIIKTPKKNNYVKIKIDPSTPIGELKVDEVLLYLQDKGEQTLNPQLKHGARNLLNQLLGRNPNRRFGSKRGGGHPSSSGRGNFVPRGGRFNANTSGRGGPMTRGRDSSQSGVYGQGRGGSRLGQVAPGRRNYQEEHQEDVYEDN
ncbi:hypothetical protein QLL95_gp0760 [Cotonvirus japonicus]|uniref:Uncharacterized protein n=1 Tax=Cotonvirus japonicus TaxID=2811091 RepID=A0ABM7NT86_9VIRU|nr:hypothetical protein QLL95_gp0760 [Cotonvirus japonicus]BCS83363.1 hypothetical protein [Cotonvirus japonicus]